MIIIYFRSTEMCHVEELWRPELKRREPSVYALDRANSIASLLFSFQFFSFFIANFSFCGVLLPNAKFFVRGLVPKMEVPCLVSLVLV